MLYLSSERSHLIQTPVQSAIAHELDIAVAIKVRTDLATETTTYQ
ncbi:MAG TPA: hypothetical protein V6D11_05140 [Waterburya sp.]